MERSEIKKAGITGYLFALVLIVMMPSLFAPLDTLAYEGQATEHDNTSTDIRRGERFFKGLLPFDRKHKACTECHNIKYADTLNWNPSAYDIALKYSSQEFSAFRAAVTQPAGGKLASSHENIVIADDDLIHVKAYLDDMAIKGALPQKPTFFNLMLFIFLGMVVIWALIELLFLRRIGYRFVPVILFLGAFGWQAKMVITEAITLGRQKHYAPSQPVKFSHKVHAGDQGIDCMYCHTTVEHSKSAGIPPVSLCMNCHVLIREGTNSGRFEIARVVDAFERENRIEWIKIHNLPDHVFFSHAQHVNAGKLDCAECHGEVETMHKVSQVHDLSMGWCLDCHRTKEVQFTSNAFYDTYEKLHEQLKKGEIEKITADMVGGEDCMKCHY